MRKIEIVEKKYSYLKIVDDLDTVLMYHISLIRSYNAVYNFIYTVDFFRETFENQVEDFDEFFEYCVFLMLKGGCRVGIELKKDPINTLLDGSIIDYNRSNEENAKLIVSSWNRSVEMYPIAKIGDKNYSKLATLSIFLPRYIED